MVKKLESFQISELFDAFVSSLPLGIKFSIYIAVNDFPYRLRDDQVDAFLLGRRSAFFDELIDKMKRMVTQLLGNINLKGGEKYG